MSFLPIVERELRVSARLSSTYRNRSLIAGGVALVGLVTLFFGSLFWRSSTVGAAMFELLAWLVLFFCMAEGIRNTADCLSEEKREGTLGLLFLTDLKGYDVVLGKLAGSSLGSFYGLLSILPVLALPMLLGGVLAEEFWRMVLALLNILFFSLCVGMFVSAISRQEQKAMGGTLLIVGLLCGLPLLTPLTSYLWLCPGFAFQAAFETSYRPQSEEYWASIAAGQLLSWLFLTGACLVVPRAWREQAVASRGAGAWRSRWARWLGNEARQTQKRKELLMMNPIVWLATRQPGVRFGLYGLAAVAALLAVAFYLNGGDGAQYYLGVCWTLNTVVKGWLAMLAARCTAEARSNNTLEMLLITPLKAERIFNGQIQGLTRVFAAPVAAILGIEMLGYTLGRVVYLGTSTVSNPGDEISGAAIIGAGYLGLFVLDMAAVMWAGLWFGLSSKKESHAVAKTVLYVLALPYVAAPFFIFCFCPGIALFFLSSVFWMAWARGRLQTRFREQAGRRDGFARSDGPIVFVPRVNQPPPLPPIMNR